MQARSQLAFQRTPALNVERLVRRNPAWDDNSISKPVLHIFPQRQVGGQLRLFRAIGSSCGVPPRGACQVIQTLPLRAAALRLNSRDTVDADGPICRVATTA